MINSIKKITYWKEVLNRFKHLKCTFYILIILFLFLYYPLLRANYDYADDMMRKVDHGILWSECYGSHVAQLLGIILSHGTYMLDYSPFGQILAVFFLSLSGVVLISVFSSKRNTNIIDILSVLMLGITPNFLECISFKFDASYYGLSMFLSLAPLVFYKEKVIIYVTISTLSLLCSFMSYHASSGMYIVSIIFLSLQLYIKGTEVKEVLKLIFTSAVSYIIAMLIFVYSLTFIQFSAPALNDISEQLGLKSILFSLSRIYSFFGFTWNNYLKITLLLLLIIFIISLSINSSRNKLLTFFLVFVALLFVAILQFGPSQIFIKQLNHSERYYIGCGVTISIILLMCNEFLIKLRMMLVINILFVTTFAISTFKYGNFLNNEKQYTYNRIYPIIYDLNKIIKVNKKYYVGVVQDQEKEQFISWDSNNDPCFHLYKPLFSGSEPRLINYYFPKKKVKTQSIQMDNYSKPTNYQKIEGLNEIVRSKYYRIEIGDDGKIQIIING